jgi:ATPase family AAA domain-containing protein 3A/B
MPKFPLPGLKALKPSSASLSGGAGFENVILHPVLKRRIEHLARATANTKSHDAPFRNMLFYGHPGTGKTLVAREMARKSVSFQIHLISPLHYQFGFVCNQPCFGGAVEYFKNRLQYVTFVNLTRVLYLFF